MTADIIIYNGTLITFDPDQPQAQAMAIAGGRITAIGDDAMVKGLADDTTRMIDANGGTVLLHRQPRAPVRRLGRAVAA